MNHVRRYFRLSGILLLPLAALLLTSCGFKDIDKRFFVVTTGIDASDNQQKPYRITLRLAVPAPQIEPGGAKTQVETVDAPTIAEGVRMLKSHVDKEIDFGHCKIFIIGEKLARNNYQAILEWMNRRRDIQSVADIAIGHGNVEEILRVEPVSERYPGNALFLSFGADGTESSYTVVESVTDMSRRASEQGLDPILPIINHKKKSYIIDRAAVFDKSRMKLKLEPGETQIYMQIAENFTNSAINGDYQGRPVVLTTTFLDTTFRILKRGDEHVLKLHVKVRGVFEEAPEGLYNHDWDMIEKELSASYAKMIEKLLVKMQKAGVDPIGFGLRYRATHPGSSAYEQWKKIYPEIKFEVRSDITIEGTGLLK